MRCIYSLTADDDEQGLASRLDRQTSSFPTILSPHDREAAKPTMLYTRSRAMNRRSPGTLIAIVAGLSIPDRRLRGSIAELWSSSRWFPQLQHRVCQSRRLCRQRLEPQLVLKQPAGQPRRCARPKAVHPCRWYHTRLLQFLRDSSRPAGSDVHADLSWTRPAAIHHHRA
jgi:hypothetical protein